MNTETLHQRVCSVEGCNEKHACRGLCNKHYLRDRKGVPMETWRERFIRTHPPKNNIGLIPLSKGQMAIVDAEDYEELIHFKWCIQNSKEPHYAVRRGCVGEDTTNVYMHRQIMGFPTLGVDHISGNRLDNRRSNLRVCSQRQNMQNAGKRAGTSSRFKGVSWCKSSQKWRADIRIDGVMLWLAACDSEEDAAIYYNTAAQIFFGQYARLNVI